MHGRLVDGEGFPRADIDVYAVRTSRHRVICEASCVCVCVREIGGESSACVGLRNDHKAVMKLIEERLHEIHLEARRRREAGVSGEGGGGREEGKVLPETFARVSQVTEGSPSAIAVRADVPP